MAFGKSFVRKCAVSTGLIVVLAVAAAILSIWLEYRAVFGVRYEKNVAYSSTVAEFGDLKRADFSVDNANGDKLAVYKYYRDGIDGDSVVIFSHDFAMGGHSFYLDIVDYFVSNGFMVVAYDATGNGDSEGSAVRSLPQMVSDLNNVISFVESNEVFADKPINLFGVGVGAYASSVVLNYHPEVTSVVSVAGFNEASTYTPAGQTGALHYLYDWGRSFNTKANTRKYGDFATKTSMDGFANSDARIMIIQSSSDEIVGTDLGYDLYCEKYCDDERFDFVLYENRSHLGTFMNDLAREYFRIYNKKYAEEIGSIRDVDHAGLDEFAELERELPIWTNMLDVKLFDKIVKFYRES